MRHQFGRIAVIAAMVTAALGGSISHGQTPKSSYVRPFEDVTNRDFESNWAAGSEVEGSKIRYMGSRFEIGTETITSPASTARLRKLASLLSVTDQIPRDRKRNFDGPMQSNARINGWIGYLTEALPFGDGWLVSVRLAPTFTNPFVMGIETMTETYLVLDTGAIIYLEGRSDNPKSKGSYVEM